MPPPSSRPIFTMMGLAHRIDDYARKGDTLPKHRHVFDHSMIVLEGCVRVTTPGGATVFRKHEAALFRAGREHEIEALEDGTVILNELPANA